MIDGIEWVTTVTLCLTLKATNKTDQSHELQVSVGVWVEWLVRWFALCNEMVWESVLGLGFLFLFLFYYIILDKKRYIKRAYALSYINFGLFHQTFHSLFLFFFYWKISSESLNTLFYFFVPILAIKKDYHNKFS